MGKLDGAVKDVLQFIMEGGSVVRYHTRVGIKPDTDAHHSHGVAMLCSLLCDKYENGTTQASAYLLMAALTHDLAEQVASDVSAPAKRLLGIRDQLHDLEQGSLRAYGLDYEQHLDDEEKVVLRLADCFDMLLYCCRELSLGNRNVLLIWRRACSYAEAITAEPPVNIQVSLRASHMYESIKEIYREIVSASGPNFDVFTSK